MSYLMQLTHREIDVETAQPTTDAAETAIDVRIGISACLLGQKVRVNGGHCRNAFLVDQLGEHVSWRAVCPEVEMGLPTPREPMRLVRDKDAKPGDHRLVVSKTGEDIGARMDAWAGERLDALAHDDLDGFVFKKDSPTCGIERVKVYDHNSIPTKTGNGRWADHFRARFPNLPVEEEGRLNDPVLRENFIVRTYTHARWRRLLAEDPTPGGLVRFHTAHKMLLLAHSPQQYRELGPLVASAGTDGFDAVAGDYIAGLMSGLAERASRGRHVNTLQHFAGFLRPYLSTTHKAELQTLFTQYREGLVALIVPLTMLSHHLRTHEPHQWALNQVYLSPYPDGLMLRNHAG